MAKKKTKSTRGRKPTITDECAEEMFGMFLAKIPLADIAKQYNTTLKIVEGAKKRKKWDERRDAIEDRVMKARDDSMIEKLIREKDKQLDMIGMIFDSLYKDILQDHQNRGVRGYRKRLEIKGFGDIEKIVKTYYMIVNGGISKTENKNTDTKKVKIEIADEDAKMLLKGMANGSVEIVEDDEAVKPGNA